MRGQEWRHTILDAFRGNGGTSIVRHGTQVRTGGLGGQPRVPLAKKPAAVRRRRTQLRTPS
jgi:hypothetical protein